jgi:protein phosphatase
MPTIEWAGLSDQGPLRDNNEDYIASHVPDDPQLRAQKGHILTVADGVGGNRAGEVASSRATTHVIERYYAITNRRPPVALQDAFQQANLHVYDLGLSCPEYRRMETTLSALVLVGAQAYLAHVGDSRIYHLRGSRIEQITRDHSEVAELVRMQILTPEEAQHHPRRNIITRSVGSELVVPVDAFSLKIERDDYFVLCTDGLWEPLAQHEIATIVSGASSERACRELIDLALARGTSDNLSVQVARVVELGNTTPETRRDGLFQRMPFRSWFAPTER